MARIVSFRGLLYNQSKIPDPSKVIAPPYDVITPEEQERLYGRSPHNIVRLILNRDLDCYESAARLFERWQAERILVRDESPAIYFLRHRFGLKGVERERVGFIALARIEELSSGTIRPHERTMEGPKDDRFRLLSACRANLSPIFGLYSQAEPTINQALAEHARGEPPCIRVQDDAGGACLLWRVANPEVIRLIRREMDDKTLLIADGHHRYEAALDYRDTLRREIRNGTGREAFNYVMMYFANLSDSGLAILPTHRLLQDSSSIPVQKLDNALQRYFYVEAYPKTAEGRRWFLKALTSGSKRHRLMGTSFRQDPRYLILRLKNKRSMHRLAKHVSAVLRELDVSALHTLVFGHILGLTPEQQARFISYTQDEERALQSVETGSADAAFILNPPRPDEILAVALQGEKMPQKSTYFYPKLYTGLVINKIDPNEEIREE